MRQNRVCSAKRVTSAGKGFALLEGTHLQCKETMCSVQRECAVPGGSHMHCEYRVSGIKRKCTV